MPLAPRVPAPSDRRRNAVALAAVCLSSLMFGLEISSVPVILPTLEQRLHADFGQMQWIVNAYTLACTTVLMAAGALADRYGRKRVFTVGLLLFGATSLACGLAGSAAALIAARFAQGAAGGIMLICGTAVLAQQFQAGRERARAFAVWGVVFGIGLGFGPIIGGAIVALAGWRWVFLVHALLMLATLAPLRLGVRESRDPQASALDVPGMVTLSLAVFGLTWYIAQGPALGLASPVPLAVLAGVVASLALFVRAERRHRHPMFDFSVFRVREFSGAIVGAAAMNFSFWPFIVYLPIYFQGVLGYGVVASGALLLAYTLPTLAMPPLAERLSLRYHAGRVIPLGLLAIGVGFLLLLAGGSVDAPGWRSLLPGLLLAGAGLGLTNTPVTNTSTGAVPGDRAGMATGIDMSARFITLTLNIAVMGFVLLAGTLAGLRERFGASVSPQRLRSAAERIAAGDLQALHGLAEGADAAALAHAALAQGFAWTLWYGGLGACLLAGVCAWVFGARPVREAATA